MLWLAFEARSAESVSCMVIEDVPPFAVRGSDTLTAGPLSQDLVVNIFRIAPIAATAHIAVVTDAAQRVVAVADGELGQGVLVGSNGLRLTATLPVDAAYPLKVVATDRSGMLQCSWHVTAGHTPVLGQGGPTSPPVRPQTQPQPPRPAPAGLRCNDGTLSPTCGYCRSGCCSGHGGCK